MLKVLTGFALLLLVPVMIILRHPALWLTSIVIAIALYKGVAEHYPWYFLMVLTVVFYGLCHCVIGLIRPSPKNRLC